jgi:hypothetical protein
MRLPTVSPADLRSELGPRSLDPDRSFWSAFAELIRGQTPPTDFCNVSSTCEQPNRGSLILAGTEALTSFLFSPCHAPRLASRSDTRRAALRPLQPAPVLVPPACASLPNRDADCSAPPPSFRRVHSEDQRARVEGPSEGRVSRTHATISRACVGCIRFVAHARRRSPPWRPSGIRCHRRVTRHGRIPAAPDGPTKTFVPASPREERCLPEDQDVFHHHVTRRSRYAKGLLPPAFAPALSLTPPTRSPQGVECVVDGHCKVTVRSPAGP